MSVDPKKMKVGELREALEKRGLDTGGLKNELIHRLEMALDEEEFGVSAAPEAVETEALAGADDPLAASEETEAPPEEDIPQKTETEETAAPISAEKADAEAASTSEDKVDLSEAEKKKLDRAARFGIPVFEKSEPKEKGGMGKKGQQKGDKRGGAPFEEDDKKKAARMARFGDVKSGLSAEEIAKKEARAKRFATEEDKKKEARAARFAAAEAST